MFHEWKHEWQLFSKQIAIYIQILATDIFLCMLSLMIKMEGKGEKNDKNICILTTIITAVLLYKNAPYRGLFFPPFEHDKVFMVLSGSQNTERQ